MKESLLDTDIISYYFRKNPQVLKNFEEYINTHQKIKISRITIYEIESGLKAKRCI